jgi:hypothetical protein
MYNIPTNDNGKWTYTKFDTHEEFRDFVKSTFKKPGEYELDETSELFNEQARNFRAKGDIYCIAQFRSKDYTKYWDSEKEKCRKGAIFHNKNKTWFLPRDYYMWLNFLPIYDKIKKKFDFPLIYDVQLHMALYEELAALHYKHASITNKFGLKKELFAKWVLL